MARIGGGPRGRRQPSVGADAGGGLIARLFGGNAPAAPGRVRRLSDTKRLRELPDYLLNDIGLPTRDATARFRRS